MKYRSITTKAETLEDYVGILNGVFRLSDTEVKLVCAMIRIHVELKSNGMSFMWTKEIKRMLADSCGIENMSYINVYANILKKKKVLIENGGMFIINPLLIPSDEDGIVFILNGKIKI